MNRLSLPTAFLLLSMPVMVFAHKDELTVVKLKVQVVDSRGTPISDGQLVFNVDELDAWRSMSLNPQMPYVRETGWATTDLSFFERSTISFRKDHLHLVVRYAKADGETLPIASVSGSYRIVTDVTTSDAAKLTIKGFEGSPNDEINLILTIAATPEPVVASGKNPPSCSWVLDKEVCGNCLVGFQTCITRHIPSRAGCTPPITQPPDNVRQQPCIPPIVVQPAAEEPLQPANNEPYVAPDPAPPSQQIVKETQGAQDLHFALGSADPKVSELQDLDTRLVGSMGYTWIVITGHTDHLGSPAYNHQLALARANAVAHYCMQQGLPPDRVQVLVFGENEVTGLTDSGIQNRKATVRFYAGSQ